MQGYGFVDFESPTSALAAVHELQGQGIQVMMMIMDQFSTTLGLVSFFFGPFGHVGQLGLFWPFWSFRALLAISCWINLGK